MRKYKIYPQEVRDEVIGRFRESGLSQTQFCNLSDITITNTTLSEWLRRAGYDKFGNPWEKGQEPAPSDLNIVCYNIGENSRCKPKEVNAQGLSLQEMVAFQQDLYGLCSRLYRLGCSKENISLLDRIKGVL